MLPELKLGPTYVLAQAETSPNLSAITDARLRAHVKFLADDQLEGRAPSTRGGNLAANYIATEFKLLGLAPGAGDGSYFQMVTMVESKTDAGKGLDYQRRRGRARSSDAGRRHRRSGQASKIPT